MGTYRKKGMERIQDSLLQDLERATSNLKNNPGQTGGWKLNRPGDSTLDSQYSSIRPVKHHSTQYYLPEEPLYQNESIRRSNSNASSHDYAAVNGRTSSTPRSPTTPSSPMHEGTTYVARQPLNAPNRASANSASADFSEATDAISQKLSMLDSLLDDLNAARQSYDQNEARPRNSPASYSATLPGHSMQPQSNGYSSLNRHQVHEPHSPVNGRSNGYLVNGDSGRGRQYASRDASDVQVNQLIRDLEYNLQNTQNTPNNQSPQNTQNIYSSIARSASPPVSKPKTVTFESAMPTQAKARSPSPTHAAQIQPISEYNRNLVNIQPQQVQMNSQPIIRVPIPHASNATRELDDLMASLSDFKMNQMKGQAPGAKSNFVSLGRVQVGGHQPKNINGHVLYKHPGTLGDDLDSMIGDLEFDLNKQGVSTTVKGDCGACGRQIVGQVVTALGKVFHPEHFTCTKCNTELGNQSFFEREGLAYCERDYHRLFSPQCAYCSKPILDRCITALDKTWHPEHFFCAHCGKNFGDDGYHEKGGNAYCRDDFFKLFAPKCAGCSNPIVDNYVSALGAHWHSDCFVCRDCHLPFDGGNYFDVNGEPFCESHYHDHRGTLCASCRKPITGRCITAMFQKYHPEHFTCSFCLKQLNKGTFKKHQEKPYCHSCFDKLFA